MKERNGTRTLCALTAALLVLCSCGTTQTSPEQETPEQESAEQETPEQESAEQETPEQESAEQETPGQESPEEETLSTEEFVEVEGRRWELSFADEFDGESLDKAKWALCPEWNRQDAGGRWDDGMTSLDGEGHLVLSAGLDEDGTPLSGAIRTRGLFEQAHGYFECRLQFQHTSGFWGAFWLMGDTQGSVGQGAVDGAEIDIIESGDFPRNGVNHAIHWDGYEADHRSVSKVITNPDLYDGFHTYALAWTDEAYVFYIDGEESFRTSEPGICDVPLYLKLTCEFGTWAGAIREEELPDEVLVDYVRVYREVP